MKKTTIMFALMLGVACTASAQKTGKKKAQKSVKTEQVSNVSSDQEEKLTLTKEVYPQKEENSNLYHGLTKKLTFDRMRGQKCRFIASLSMENVPLMSA